MNIYIRKAIKKICYKGVLNFLPDKIYLKLLFKAHLNQNLNLNNPQTFNEKLQWLKLNDRKEIYTTMVDKFEVKEYVKNLISEEYIIPTLGVWDRFEDIDFNTLPNQFVLKCTHNSGGIVICKDKNELNVKEAKNKIEKSLRNKYFYSGREWPYKNVKPRIIAEEYLEDESGTELKDYKVLCFNGKAKLIELHSGRFCNHTQDFYDINWKKADISQGPTSKKFFKKPYNLEKMIELSELIAKNMIHVRVDWYNIKDKLYFGEITLYDGSGFEKFDKYEYDKMIGDWITLNNKKEEVI